MYRGGGFDRGSHLSGKQMTTTSWYVLADTPWFYLRDTAENSVQFGFIYIATIHKKRCLMTLTYRAGLDQTVLLPKTHINQPLFFEKTQLIFDKRVTCFSTAFRFYCDIWQCIGEFFMSAINSVSVSNCKKVETQRWRHKQTDKC